MPSAKTVMLFFRTSDTNCVTVLLVEHMTAMSAATALSIMDNGITVKDTSLMSVGSFLLTNFNSRLANIITCSEHCGSTTGRVASGTSFSKTTSDNSSVCGNFFSSLGFTTTLVASITLFETVRFDKIFLIKDAAYSVTS